MESSYGGEQLMWRAVMGEKLRRREVKVESSYGGEQLWWRAVMVERS